MDETEFNSTSLTHRGPKRKKKGKNDGIAKEDHMLTSMCMWKEK
jgi:hypothetical protein